MDPTRRSPPATWRRCCTGWTAAPPPWCELQQRGQGFLAETGPDDHDGRVHRYIAADAAHTAASAA
jgi:hypothetical protein